MYLTVQMASDEDLLEELDDDGNNEKNESADPPTFNRLGAEEGFPPKHEPEGSGKDKTDLPHFIMKAVKEAADQSNTEMKDLLSSTTKLSNQLLKMMQTLQGQSQKTMPPHPSLQLMPPQPKGHHINLTKRAGTVGQENCHYSTL